MSEQDWANRPSATASAQPPDTHDPEQWNPSEPARRSTSPSRTGNMERSRSPLGSRIGPDHGSQTTGRGRSSDVVNPGNNLHVSGISLKADDQELADLFSKYGTVIKSQLMRDPHTRELRGFGFVTMETSEQAELATSSLNGTEFLGKTLSIEKARRARGRTPTPGQYRGPKREDGHRPYEPRGGYYYRHGPYDRRYDDPIYDAGRYPVRREFDIRRYGYDDRAPGFDRFGYAAPMRDRFDDRFDRRRDDRDNDRRRY